ncbi:MAG: acyltransferase family protein [Pseudomonadota bacterium]
MSDSQPGRNLTLANLADVMPAINYEKNTPRTSEPIIVIEVVRFLCALLVLGVHYFTGFWFSPGSKPALLLEGIHYRSPIERFTQIGWLGVEIFFVISGMVIARSALGVSAIDFVWRRFLRLAPGAWIAATLTLIMVAIAGQGGRDLMISWIRSASFWPFGEQIDGSYWTLGIEICFYALVALLLLKKGDTEKRLEGLAWLLALASSVFWIYKLATLDDLSHPSIRRFVELTLLPHGCFFAIGICISQYISLGSSRNRLLLFAIACIPASIEVIVHAAESAVVTHWPSAALPALLVFASACVLLASSAALQPKLRSWVSPRFARSIGAATFPLYLIHQDAGAAVTAMLVHSDEAEPGLALCITAILAIAAAWLISQFCEPPARQWLDKVVRQNIPMWRAAQ